MRLFFASLLLGGCAYRVPVRVEPASATLKVGRRPEVAAPASIRVRFGAPTSVVAAAPGFREYPLVLRWNVREGALGPRPIEIRMVPEHGHAGTNPR